MFSIFRKNEVVYIVAAPLNNPTYIAESDDFPTPSPILSVILF